MNLKITLICLLWKAEYLWVVDKKKSIVDIILGFGKYQRMFFTIFVPEFFDQSSSASTTDTSIKPYS